MTENITLEQKEKNRQYILNNLDKYTIDANGDFFNFDPELLGEEYDYINRNTLTWKAVEEIKKKMTEMIIKNIKNWELILFDTENAYPNFFKNKETGLIIEKGRLGYWNEYYIVGEFGYRRGKWKEYEKWKEERQKNTSASSSNQKTTPLPTNPQTENKQANQEYKKAKKEAEQKEQNQPPKPTNQNNNTPDQSNPTPNQEPQEQPTNNPLPSPETIQENYNNDKDKSTIENNSNSTTPEQKEQSETLLKLIIEAEFLIKDKQFNSETLSKLIQEKEQNTESYQLLKERIEQAINELSSLEQQNNNNESVVNNNESDISPIKIFAIVGVIGAILMISVAVFRKIRNKKIKIK